jgi:antitoxin HigA-1
MHPGELLRDEILPALDRPKTEIAKLLGVSRQTLYDAEGKAAGHPRDGVAAREAVRKRPRSLAQSAQRYDLHQAQRELGETIKNIPTLEVA